MVDGNIDQPLPPHATLNILEAVNQEGVDELLTMANVVMGLPVMASWVRRALVFSITPISRPLPPVAPRSTHGLPVTASWVRRERVCHKKSLPLVFFNHANIPAVTRSTAEYTPGQHNISMAEIRIQP